MGELVAIIVCSVLGFVIGGFVGEVQIHAWFPYAWYGLGIGFVISIAAISGCACCVDDVYDIFD